MRINGQILADIIEPLEIVPTEIILDVYRQKAKLDKSDLNNIRGILIPVWDESGCGSNVLIENNGKVVCLKSKTSSWRNVRAKMVLENKGIFEWEVIIEKYIVDVWIGVCASEGLNYEFWAGRQATGWVLGTSGKCFNSNNQINYCPSFQEDGAKIIVHLDMSRRTCAFTVNGTKYQEVSEWNNLSSKLYPVVSFNYPARIRIQPHQKAI